MMLANDIRTRFLQFFEKRGHTIIPSASLVTPDEKGVTNSTLFNTAGMQPLVPYLLGQPYLVDGAEKKRLVDVQKCLRTVDLDEVGDKTHATFFEMLGNWSLGDYFKKDAIKWSYEFLTSKEEGLGLDPNRLYVTVFAGDANAPRDDEAADLWRQQLARNQIAVGGETAQGEAGRIFYLPAAKNWWEAGENGPCGPDTEMYYDVKDRFGGRPITLEEFVAADDQRDLVEIWNDVFMQYEKRDGKIVGALPRPSVDTGAGLERLAMVMQGVDNIYDTDLLQPIVKLIKPPGFESEESNIRMIRITADHIRASVFLIADGVLPSNTGRGYILRRLIRRAIFSMRAKRINDGDIERLVDAVVDIYKNLYDGIKEQKQKIIEVIKKEAEQFERILSEGIPEAEKIVSGAEKVVSGKDVFTLSSTLGIPVDLTAEIAKKRGKEINLKEYEEEIRKHQELSRVGAEQKFKGGLGDANDPMVVRYHTATHLLHQALFDVLGAGVMQKGSNITPERLRFDFAHPVKMTEAEKRQVESIVDEKIAAKLPVKQVTLPKDEAIKTGAKHFFGEKYPDQVSVYFVGPDLEGAYSKEFCGGPHVSNTAELAGPDGQWRFKILKEEAVAAGIRRIKAVLTK